MHSVETIYTIQDIARLRRVPYYVVRYAVDVGGVEPLRRVGNVRVWGEHQLDEVNAAIDRTSKRREAAACA